MNICLLPSIFLPKVGGLEIVVHNLATALANRDHNVVVVAPNRGVYKPDISHNYNIVRFGFRGSTRLRLTSLVAVSTLIRVARKFAIDVINVHNVHAPGTWVYYFRCLKKKIPLVGTPHGADLQIFPTLQYGVRLDPKVDRIIQRNVKNFTLLTAISNSIYSGLKEIVQNDTAIKHIPNGIWTSHFENKFDRAKVRKQHGIPINSTVIISVGRNVPIKGFELGLRAVAKLVNAGYRITYILVGRNMSEIVEKARELGISDLIITPGQLASEEVAKLYQGSDIYVSTSYIESFGVTTLEAMCSALPCVVTDVPGNRDLVSSDYGLLVPPGSVDALAEAIRRLIENAPFRKKLGTEAHIAARRFDWHSISASYIDAYAEAIKTLSSQA